AALGANAVVVGRIDRAIGDPDILAAVEVDAVAVGVDLEIVAGPVVDSRGEDAEVAAVIDREIAEDDVAAILERDRFVADSGRKGVPPGSAKRAGLKFFDFGPRAGGEGVLGSTAAEVGGGVEAIGAAARKPAAEYSARPGDGDVLEILAPDPAV